MEAAIGMEIREHKGSFAVYVVLRVLVIAVAVLKFFNGDYEAVFLCILTLLLLLAPAFVQVRFRIELPSALEVIVLVFVFAAEILGEISSFYEIFPFWDTVLHTMNGFLAAAIGFSLVDLLNRSDRVKFELSPLYLAIVSLLLDDDRRGLGVLRILDGHAVRIRHAEGRRRAFDQLSDARSGPRQSRHSYQRHHAGGGQWARPRPWRLS